MKGFTGIKDLDLKILMDVDDETLLKTCSTNKELYRICNVDQAFWRNRYVKQYGEKSSRYKPEGRSWKNHYMQTYIDLHRLKNPMDFFSYIAWKSNVDDSFYIDDKEIKPLREAPEWVMNNLWLLRLRDIPILSFAPNVLFSASETIYKDITPVELLKSNQVPPDLYLYDFNKIHGGKYIANFATLEAISERFEEF